MRSLQSGTPVIDFAGPAAHDALVGRSGVIAIAASLLVLPALGCGEPDEPSDAGGSHMDGGHVADAGSHDASMVLDAGTAAEDGGADGASVDDGSASADAGAGLRCVEDLGGFCLGTCLPGSHAAEVATSDCSTCCVVDRFDCVGAGGHCGTSCSPPYLPFTQADTPHTCAPSEHCCLPVTTHPPAPLPLCSGYGRCAATCDAEETAVPARTCPGYRCCLARFDPCPGFCQTSPNCERGKVDDPNYAWVYSSTCPLYCCVPPPRDCSSAGGRCDGGAGCPSDATTFTAYECGGAACCVGGTYPFDCAEIGGVCAPPPETCLPEWEAVPALECDGGECCIEPSPS